MARRRKVEVQTGEDHDEVIRWYRERLAEPAAFPWVGATWEPVRIGPTWQTTPDGRWLLPDATIGWDFLGWTGTELRHGRGQPWRFTLEQARFLLWWYAVDSDGRWLAHDGVLQRLKGWGKDPVGATLLYGEAFGPCRVAYMDGDTPVATDCPEAWVQTAATALEQTKNTMRLMPGLITPEAKAHYGIQVGKELIHGLGDERLIQAVTSSPATLEGARATFVLKNETHHWLANNEGHEMAATIERNATKSADGAARTLGITNAYEPGEDSVAQHDREAWEDAVAGKSMTTGLLYDSLEAPPEAPLALEREDDEDDGAYEERVRSTITEVVSAIRGDATWLDTKRITKSVLDTRNPPSRSRRFWYNQITAAEDAWLAPQEWDAAADATIVVSAGDTVTLGFDGSLSDDHTALIGCLVDRDHLFEIEVWTPDPVTGQIDRAAVDRGVRAALELYDVVGFYGDVHPWESYVDTWGEEFAEDLVVKATPRHAIGWDMRTRTKEFTAAVERLHAAIVESAKRSTDGTPGPRLTHCGSARFRQHVHNAKRAPNPWGISVRKEHRESARKIDSVPAATLARLARADFLALPEHRRKRKKRSGVVW